MLRSRLQSWRPGGREGAEENTVPLLAMRGERRSSSTCMSNTTAHFFRINTLFSALCAKPVPSLSVSFFSLSFCLSLCSLFSSDNDQSESDTLPELLSQSDVDQAPSQPALVRREDRSDASPRKTFLSAGLYSDDYKTAE